MAANLCHGKRMTEAIHETGRYAVLSTGPGIPELAVMADVLNLETESTPLSTQLETPELESVTAVAEPLPESTSNHVAPEELETVEAASVATGLDFAAPETAAPETVLPATSVDSAPVEIESAPEPAVAEAPVAEASAAEAEEVAATPAPVAEAAPAVSAPAASARPVAHQKPIDRKPLVPVVANVAPSPQSKTAHKPCRPPPPGPNPKDRTK